MNERIRELAKQAEQYADDTMNSDPAKYDRPGQVKVWRELMQAKFAELIVRECVKEIEFQYGGGSDQPMDNEWDRAVECVSSMVKYRFGVE